MLFFYEGIESSKKSFAYLGDHKDQLLLFAQVCHQTLDYQVVQVHLKVLLLLFKNKEELLMNSLCYVRSEFQLLM